MQQGTALTVHLIVMTISFEQPLLVVAVEEVDLPGTDCTGQSVLDRGSVWEKEASRNVCCIYATRLARYHRPVYAELAPANWALTHHPMPTSSSSISSEGFTAIPRPIFDLLLCLPINKRDLTVLLLVARLTYGCRDRQWAHLKQADLITVGIGPTHAKSCLKSLLSRRLLIQNGTRLEFRLNVLEQTTHIEKETDVRLSRLTTLVSYHLGSSQTGNISPASLPKTVTPPLPNEELYPYQNGNIQAASGWSFSHSSRQFEKDFDSS